MQTITAVDLIRPGIVHQLCQQNRRPFKVATLGCDHEGRPIDVLYAIPPEGVQLGDRPRRRNYMDAILQGIDPTGYGDMGTIEYYDPRTGQSRGICELVTVARSYSEIMQNSKCKIFYN